MGVGCRAKCRGIVVACVRTAEHAVDALGWGHREAGPRSGVDRESGISEVRLGVQSGGASGGSGMWVGSVVTNPPPLHVKLLCTSWTHLRRFNPTVSPAWSANFLQHIIQKEDPCTCVLNVRIVGLATGELFCRSVG